MGGNGKGFWGELIIALRQAQGLELVETANLKLLIGGRRQRGRGQISLRRISQVRFRIESLTGRAGWSRFSVFAMTDCKTIRLLLVTCVLFLAGCATGVVDTTRTFHTVVIDPGHGGKDSGVARNHLQEKNLALDVALRLRPKLQAAGFNTVMTRTTDVFIPLEDRAAISNAHSEVFFISIHFNDSPKRAIHGATVYYHTPVAAPMALEIANSLGTITTNRGIMTANFRVLRKNHYPAVLVECGFVSNRTEAARCGSADFREALASRIAAAIIQKRFGAQ
jgi:N-acetylmuramoyl-L-alanine amidase